MKIANILCGYKLCDDWHCPLKNRGMCIRYKLTNEEIVRLFIHTMYINPDFRRHVKESYPNEYIKYYNGVQYD